MSPEQSAEPQEVSSDVDNLVELFLRGPDFAALQNRKEKRRRTRERNQHHKEK